jgi:hypothetical protein
LKRAGIEGKTIGWHSFRHSLATNLRAAGVDLKTTREFLRHANSRITLDAYTRAVSATKREANDRLLKMVLEAANKKPSFSTLVSTLNKEKRRKWLRPSAPSRKMLDVVVCHKPFVSLRFYGGDDGARTRDLCRDRTQFAGN